MRRLDIFVLLAVLCLFHKTSTLCTPAVLLPFNNKFHLACLAEPLAEEDLSNQPLEMNLKNEKIPLKTDDEVIERYWFSCSPYYKYAASLMYFEQRGTAHESGWVQRCRTESPRSGSREIPVPGAVLLALLARLVHTWLITLADRSEPPDEHHHQLSLLPSRDLLARGYF
jgi:hypothetical protein